MAIETDETEDGICHHCDDTCEITCPSCGGDAFDADEDDDTCKQCNNSGTVACPHC